MNATEKRRAKRFPMRLPVAVKAEQLKSEKQVVETRDVSSSGVYFEFGTPLEVGASVEFLLTLPEPITKGSPVRIRCIGKVVRVEKNSSGEKGHLGVAATIERYEFVRET
ncbi:MAG: PilZ domain-containing protein [Acidobacteria bacterium]|nr:PilZ domain-containing protein [Acidobacteriota bacterium]